MSLAIFFLFFGKKTGKDMIRMNRVFPCLGQFISRQPPTAWAYIVIACAIGIVFYAILTVAETIVMKNRK